MLDFNTCETVENICGDLATTHTHNERKYFIRNSWKAICRRPDNDLLY